MLRSVDVNCDLGESFGRYELGADEQVVPLVSSVNVACGMHAGDPCTMRRTVALAAGCRVAVGAHPGYPDLQGFGRRDMGLSPDEVYAYVLYQTSALAGFARAAGVRLHHVKPHGQLYNRAAADPAVADAVAAAVRDLDAGLVLVGLAGSELVCAGRAAGLTVAEEFFVDRGYTPAGTLVRRGEPGASVRDEQTAVARAVCAVTEGLVEAVDGSLVPVAADTLCVHGDGPAALAFAARLRAALNEAGIVVRPVAAREPDCPERPAGLASPLTR